MKDVADISSKTKLYQEVLPLTDLLLNGIVLVIDPSIGSTSSSPGYAIYRKGELVVSGTWYTGGSLSPLWQRARSLGKYLEGICQEYYPDLMIYEDIPATSSFNQNAVASLLKAVGVVLACTKSEYVLGIHPASWRNYVRKEYTKGDEEDAIEIGHIAISLAKHIASSRSAISSDGKGNGRRQSRGNKGSGKSD